MLIVILTFGIRDCCLIKNIRSRNKKIKSKRSCAKAHDPFDAFVRYLQIFVDDTEGSASTERSAVFSEEGDNDPLEQPFLGPNGVPLLNRHKSLRSLNEIDVVRLNFHRLETDLLKTILQMSLRFCTR